MFGTVCIQIPGSKLQSSSFLSMQLTATTSSGARNKMCWILIFILLVTEVRTLNNFPFPWGGASTCGGTWIGLIIRGSHTCTFINNGTQAELIRVFTPLVIFFIVFFFFFPASKGRRRAKVVNMRTVQTFRALLSPACWVFLAAVEQLKVSVAFFNCLRQATHNKVFINPLSSDIKLHILLTGLLIFLILLVQRIWLNTNWWHFQFDDHSLYSHDLCVSWNSDYSKDKVDCGHC